MIGGSIFPHQRINKVNWRLPDHVTENQIDHICINKRCGKAWKDVRVIRIADNPSDHHLLTTAVRLRLRKFNNITNKIKKYNVSLLKTEEVRIAFHISLSNKFQPLQDQLENTDTNIPNKGQHISKMWRGTCKEVLGRRQTQHKERISADIL